MISRLNRVRPFLGQLKEIFMAMDRAYDRAADRYGFICRGCEDNCCRTRFFHHTFLEYFYLYEGFQRLEPDQADRVIENAGSVIRAMSRAGQTGGVFRKMCPLNHDGRCLIYVHRPMICRMHGVPHELQKPGQEKQLGAGCGYFMERFGTENYAPFDRTPFYIKMAGLESELKKTLMIPDRIKMTVAQMVGTWKK